MAHSIRVFYANQIGRVRKNFNWPPINKKSAVVITAAEFFFTGGSLEDIRPHVGEAKIEVSNVGVHGEEGGSGGVEFYLWVNWQEPLNVMVTITVLDDIEQYHLA